MIDWFIGGATKYKKLVVNNRDISQLVGTVTWSGDSKQVARKLVFTVAARASDRFLPKVPIREGDQVVFSYKDKSAPEKVLFGGPVLDIDKAASGNSITYTALAELKNLAHEMVRKFAAIGVPVNQRKCKIIPLTKPFKFCKAKFRLQETGKVIVNGCRDGMKRARRKLKYFKREVEAGRRAMEDVKQFMTCQLAYYKNYNDHGRVLRLSRLCFALFGDIMGGKPCIELPGTGPASA